MTTDIQQFLQTTKNTHDYLKKAGRDDLAEKVLSTGITVAQTALLLNQVQRVCSCGRVITTTDEKEFFDQVGECMACDHVRSSL